eukprot:UN0339
MLPSLRASRVSRSVAPCWLFACLCQTGWTLAFAREAMALSEVLMLGILVGLMGAAYSADIKDTTTREFWLLRSPLSLHLGWIICASAVNTNILAVSHLAGPGSMLAVAIAALVAIAVLAVLYAFAAPKPDCIPSLVVAWALLAVDSELQSARNLQDPSKFNPYVWDAVVLEGIRGAALALSVACVGLAVLASVLRLTTTRSTGKIQGSADQRESLTP